MFGAYIDHRRPRTTEVPRGGNSSTVHPKATAPDQVLHLYGPNDRQRRHLRCRESCATATDEPTSSKNAEIKSDRMPESPRATLISWKAPKPWQTHYSQPCLRKDPPVEAVMKK